MRRVAMKDAVLAAIVAVCVVLSSLLSFQSCQRIAKASGLAAQFSALRSYVESRVNEENVR